MEFVHKSGLYPDIAVPDIYAYDLSFSNPVGAPYTLMQLLEGTTYRYVKSEYHLNTPDLLPHSDQLSMVKAFSKLQVQLCKPVPFNQIGSIFIDESGEFSIGPLFDFDGREYGGPFDSVEELWNAQLHRMILENDCDFTEYLNPGALHEFARIYQKLAALIPYFIPPEPYLQPVLYHPDLAFHNVFFEPEGYSKTTGVVDWAGDGYFISFSLYTDH